MVPVASWEQDIVTALRNLNGVASYSEIYAEVEKIRDNLPKTWKDIIRRRVQDMSSDSAGFKGGPDLFYSVEGLGNGVWGLRGMEQYTPKASDLEEPTVEELLTLPDGNEAPSRVELVTYRILRDSKLARDIKKLHNDQCQVCGATITFPDGRTYSEAHHIIPLGGIHKGPDVAENIIVLCPNCHARCDQWDLELRLEDIRQIPEHRISAESLEYHSQQQRSLYGDTVSFTG